MFSNTSENPFVVRSLENLFDPLSPEDQQSFLARSSTSSSPAPKFMGTPNLNALQARIEDSDTSPTPNQVGATKATAARRCPLLSGRKKKRPLNAFIAYRSYYSPILSGLTQKAKSGIIRQMWAEEPRKQLFTLVGQAYSELRDNIAIAGLDKDFLKIFLPATVAILPIIPADSYLDAMGWERRVNSDGEEILERSGSVASRPDASMGTNYSVADIINYCYNTGVATRSSSFTASPGRNTGGAMSFAAAPSMSATLRRQLWPSVENPAIDAQAVVPVSTADVISAARTEMPIAPEFDFSDLGPNHALTIEQVTADQQQAFDQIPLPMHFHPGIQPPVLGFDPNLIQDDFDPYNFDIDQYLNFDFRI